MIGFCTFWGVFRVYVSTRRLNVKVWQRPAQVLTWKYGLSAQSKTCTMQHAGTSGPLRRRAYGLPDHLRSDRSHKVSINILQLIGMHISAIGSWKTVLGVRGIFVGSFGPSSRWCRWDPKLRETMRNSLKLLGRRFLLVRVEAP